MRSYSQELRMFFILSPSFPEWEQYRKVGIYNYIGYYIITYHIGQEISYVPFEDGWGNEFQYMCTPPRLPHSHKHKHVA